MAKTITRDHTPAIAALLLLSAWGFWTLWAFPYRNGLLNILQSKTKPGALIPGPLAAPMKQSYTGLSVIDKELTVLVSFFYTAIDGNRLDVSLQFLDLGGQVLAAWTLITVEGLRQGNGGYWVVTLTTLFGVGVAILGFACVAPLWYAYHLWQSPTVDHSDQSLLRVSSIRHLHVAPLSIAVGFGLPSAIMCLPAPAWISTDTKQMWTGVQQGWPIWIACTEFALTTVMAMRGTPQAESDDMSQMVKSLKHAYIFGIMSSTGAHLLAWTVSLTSMVAPSLLGHDRSRLLHPVNLLVPVNPLGGSKANTLADGALWFLQWDLITGALATLLWATAVRQSASSQTTSLSSRGRLARVVPAALLMGPCGAAVLEVWGRDSLVFENDAGGEKAKET